MRSMKRSSLPYINEGVNDILHQINLVVDNIDETLTVWGDALRELEANEAAAREKANSFTDWDSDEYFEAEDTLLKISREVLELDNAIELLKNLREQLTEEN